MEKRSAFKEVWQETKGKVTFILSNACFIAALVYLYAFPGEWSDKQVLLIALMVVMLFSGTTFSNMLREKGREIAEEERVKKASTVVHKKKKKK